MRACVRDAFVDFTSPLEGVVPWMYLDILGLVTTAIGNLIDASPQPHPETPALSLPWVHMDGQRATPDEIRAEWLKVKRNPVAARRGHRFTEGLCDLRLTHDGVLSVVARKLTEMDEHLSRRFPEWEDWPADAQLATLSLSWACGPAFRFPELEASLRRKDFAMAAGDCHIREDGNPGVAPRNRANTTLYRNAAKVVAYGLDFDTLVWPDVLNEDASNAASSPTLYPLPPKGPADV